MDRRGGGIVVEHCSCRRDGVATPPKRRMPQIKKFESGLVFANWKRAGNVHEELVKPHKCFGTEYDTQQGDFENIQG